MKKILFVCFLSLLCISMQAQLEANNWIFGLGAGLTWNTTTTRTATGVLNVPSSVQLSGIPTNMPTTPTNPMDTYEGCFTVSSPTGALLFFSDGVTVWNQNKVVMDNGGQLSGNYSAAQSGIIIPFPGSSSKYMAITIGYHANGGLSYSVVDMAALSGIGVVTSEKNIAFTGSYSGLPGESVTAVRHKNKRDYWVVAPGKAADGTYLNVWLATDQGVQFVRSTGKIGFIISDYASSSNGYIKFSPDGKQFAWGTWTAKRLVWGNFDTEIGTFSNIAFSQESAGYDYYGVEFSPSGKYLYVSANHRDLGIRRFKFSSLLEKGFVEIGINMYYFQESIIPTTAVASGRNMGAIQLSPDGRIYGSDGRYDLLIIDDIEEDIDHVKAYRLPNYITGTARSGLPSFLASWFAAKLQGKEKVCINTPQVFKLEISRNEYLYVLSHVVVDFGDGNTLNIPISSTDEEITRTHTYATNGVFTISATFYGSDNNPISYLTQRHKVHVIPCDIPVNPGIRTNLHYE